MLVQKQATFLVVSDITAVHIKANNTWCKVLSAQLYIIYIYIYIYIYIKDRNIRSNQKVHRNNRNDLEVVGLIRNCTNMLLSWYFSLHYKTNKCTYVRCVYHILSITNMFHITIVTIIRVTYKNIRNPNNLSKCKSEPLDVTKNLIKFSFLKTSKTGRIVLCS
jgi:hypothetical protein